MRWADPVFRWLLLGMILTACVPIGSREEQITPAASLSPVPSTTLSTGTPFHTPYSFTPATQPGEQTYVDPQGWYTVTFPIGWKSTGNPNSYSGEGGFFETGYLPGLMFMQDTLDVCQWLANIDSKSTYSITWIPSYRCELTSLPGITPAVIEMILENPTADYPQRYVYLKADPVHFAAIYATFAWTRLVNEGAQPIFSPVPLSTTDASFWGKVAPMPAGLTVEEYELPLEAQSEDPGETIFLKFIPTQARPTNQPVMVWYGETWDQINQKIKPFGYELRPEGQASLHQLYKNGTLLVNHVYTEPDIYLFPTSARVKLAFVIYSIKDPNASPYSDENSVGYLVQNDSILPWDGVANPMDPGLPPVLSKDDLLWVQVGDGTQVQVLNSHREVLFSFETYFGTRLPVNGFKAWNDHWILEISDFVVQDGIILNGAYGFEQVFDWNLINGKPFYFFRKGQRVGISYDGKFLPLYYQDVLHDYCCGLSANNPEIKDHTVRFFAKKAGLWYYVILSAG